MESIRTDFQPKTHGFCFRNCFDFPDFFQIKLPLIQTGVTSLGDLVYGLCGGMCFAALDFYYAHITPPQNTKTEEIPWPFFLYLWRRQLHSLRKAVL